MEAMRKGTLKAAEKAVLIGFGRGLNALVARETVNATFGGAVT
jgi:hypothetical protein